MKESTSNFLMGFLAGAAAGALAGILFAPDKGSNTRKKLKKQVLDLSDEYGLGIGELIGDLGIGEEPPAKEPARRKKTAKARKPKASSE